jgi:hypothetical protein
MILTQEALFPVLTLFGVTVALLAVKLVVDLVRGNVN